MQKCAECAECANKSAIKYADKMYANVQNMQNMQLNMRFIPMQLSCITFRQDLWDILLDKYNISHKSCQQDLQTGQA
jgi:hypothetical protein